VGFHILSFGNYHPVTWISHMADSGIYDLDPRGIILVSLAFHIVNTLLVFLVFSVFPGPTGQVSGWALFIRSASPERGIGSMDL